MITSKRNTIIRKDRFLRFRSTLNLRDKNLTQNHFQSCQYFFKKGERIHENKKIIREEVPSGISKTKLCKKNKQGGVKFGYNILSIQ